MASEHAELQAGGDRILSPIPSLTGLRFVAAGSVFLSHSLTFIVPMPGGSPPLWYIAASSLAGFGMPLFFVLSGFVIHFNYSDAIKRERGRGTYNFFVARFARIYPLFLFCVAYDLIFQYSYSSLPESSAQALPYYLTMTQTWVYVALGKHALVYQFGPMPSVGWSIATEWFFYCTYPVLCYVIAVLRTLRSVLLAIGMLCAFAFVTLAAIGTLEPTINQLATDHFGPIADEANGFQDSFFRWLVYFSPYSRVLEFSVGCLCAEIHRRLQRLPIQQREQTMGKWMTAAAVAAVALSFAFLYPLKGISPLPEQISKALSLCFGMAPAIGFLLFCCARYDNAIVRSLSHPLLVLGGEASYSLYMFHLTVILAFRWEAAPVNSDRVLVGDLLRLGLTAAAAVGLSLVTWRLIEIPARRWLREKLILGPSLSEAEPAKIPLPDRPIRWG